MARKRMIDPNFWTDEKLGECSIQERMLFMGLISNSDDEGYGRANPKLLKSIIFPYDDIKSTDLEKWLNHLAELNIVVLYKYDGQTYYYLPNFLKHQTINKPTKSVFPKYDDERCSSTTVVILEHYLLIEKKRIEKKRIEKKRKRKEMQ